MQSKTVALVAVCTLVVAVAPVALFMGYTSPALRRLEMQNQQLLKHMQHTTQQQKQQQPQQPTLHVDRMNPPPRRVVRDAESASPAPRADVALPSKWAAKYLLPRYFQEVRGCTFSKIYFYFYF